MSTQDGNALERYVLGGYEIVGTLGSGGMGVVYRAHDVNLGRPVALKVLRDDLRNNPHVIARFRREAEAFAKLNHPNIVQIYSVGVVGRIPYIAMEYIDGEPLNEWLATKGAMPWETALEIGAQLASGLAAAHAEGIIHRDIKPGNILLGADRRVYLTDFGIAKIVGASTQLTVDGSRLGTPQYMCPERCRNAEVSHRSDIYSLGVVLFQAISGKLPFAAESGAEFIRKISSEEPARLREFAPHVPEEVERLIAYMMERDPKRRPPDAHALRAAIDRVRRGERLDPHADELASALAAMRETVNTPAPVPAQPSLRDRAASLWYRIPAVFRIGLALSVLLVLAGGGAWWVASRVATPAYLPAPELGGGVARWRVPSQLAIYREETANVGLMALNIPGFTLVGVLPVPGTSDVALLLDEKGGRQRAVLHLSPEARAASMWLPAMPDYTVLAATQTASGQATSLLLDTPTGVWSMRRGALEPKFLNERRNLAAVAAGGGFVFAERGQGVHKIWHTDATLGEERILAQGDGEVQSIAATADALRMAVSRIVPSGEMSLWLHTAANAGQGGWKLDDGDYALHPQAFSVEGTRFAAVKREAAGGALRIFDAVSGVPAGEAGHAKLAAWRPNGDELVLIAPDSAGREQIWLCGAGENHERRQITFLGAGVSHALGLSADGKFAISADGEGSAALIAKLD